MTGIDGIVGGVALDLVNEGDAAVRGIGIRAEGLEVTREEVGLGDQGVGEGAGHALGLDAALSEVVHLGLDLLELGDAGVEDLEAGSDRVAFVHDGVLQPEGDVAEVAHELDVSPGPHGPGLAVELGPVGDAGGVRDFLLLLEDARDAGRPCDNGEEVVEVAVGVGDRHLVHVEITDTAVSGVVLGIVLAVGLGVVPVVVAAAGQAECGAVAHGERLESLADGGGDEGVIHLVGRGDAEVVRLAAGQEERSGQGDGGVKYLFHILLSVR